MNYFLLLLCIIIPVTLPIILCFKVKGYSPKSIAGWKDTFKISPDEWLLSQTLFWCSLSIPFLLFLSFGSISWKEYDLEISQKNFDTFLEISKLPLWLLAIAAPFSVIIARAHGTEQTATQIKELIKKNNSDSYQSQRSDFLAYFKNTNIGIKAYSNFYSSTIEKGAFPPNEELILKTKLTIQRSLSVMRSIYIEHSNKNSDLDFHYKLAINALIETQNLFTIPAFQEVLKSNIYYFSKKEKIETATNIQYEKYPLISIKVLTESLIELTNTHNQLCEYIHSSDNINNDDPSLLFTTSLLNQINSKKLPIIDNAISSINAQIGMEVTIQASPLLKDILEKKLSDS